MSKLNENYNGHIDENPESKQSEIISVIKNTKSELNDFKHTNFWGKQTDNTENIDTQDSNIKINTKNIIEESISNEKAPLLYTKNAKETLIDYIIHGKLNTKENIMLEVQLEKLINNPQNWKLKYIVDNSDKPLETLIDKINKKVKNLKLLNEHTKYDNIINKYSNQNNIDSLLVKSIIYQESKFNPNARSGAGAKGLMQLTPITITEIERTSKVKIKNVYSPEENIMGGVKYISDLIKKYEGDIPLALAAYNAGPGNVSKYGNSIPPFKETQNYVKKIMNMYNAINLS